MRSICVLLILTALIHIAPYVYVDKINGDTQWQMWHLSMLLVNVFSQGVIFMLVHNRTWLYVKGLSFVILLMSVYFLLDYIFINFEIDIDSPLEDVLKLYKEISSG